LTFILGNRAGGKINLSPALYFRTIVQPEAFFSQEQQRLRKKHSPAGNQRKGWTVVDMKKDWKVIYPFEIKNPFLFKVFVVK
jgi:hypothetical protein